MRSDIGIASMLLNLELVESTDIDTLATDGTKILWNPNFVSETNADELEAVLIHEALHVVFEHPLRFGGRNHKLWNVACDYAINNYLWYELNYPLPEGGLWDRKYYEMTAEQIYRILDTDDEALQEAKQQASGGQSSDGEEDGQSGAGSSDESEEAEGESETGKYSSVTENSCGDKYDDIPNLVGEIIEPTNEDGDKLDSAKIEEIATDIRSKVFMADKVASINGTSSMRGAVESIKGQVSNWLEILADKLWNCISQDQTWAVPNRRHLHRGVYLPSAMRNPTGGTLAFAIDTSGSISQHELNIYAVEIEELVKMLNLDRVMVCYCDTNINKNDKGEFWDVFDIASGDEIKLEMRGGGGTAFDPPFNLFNEFTDDVEDVCAFIYFTDGYGYVSPEVEPNVPVIWAITDEWKSRDADMPFGEVIKVDVRHFA